MKIRNRSTRFSVEARTHFPVGETMKAILAFLKDESGPTAVEYAVMLALIILTMYASVALFGQTTATTWGDIDTEIQKL